MSCECFEDSSFQDCKVHPSDFIIIGFPKCGTVALQQWLENKYKTVHTHRKEIIWDKKATRIWEDRFAGCVPVIITRDPVERIWSAFNYYKWLEGLDFETWINNKDPINATGTTSPIEAVKYERFIQPFLKYKPIILKLENLRGLPDFPRENVNQKRTFMPEQFRQLVGKLLG